MQVSEFHDRRDYVRLHDNNSAVERGIVQQGRAAIVAAVQRQDTTNRHHRLVRGISRHLDPRVLPLREKENETRKFNRLEK